MRVSKLAPILAALLLALTAAGCNKLRARDQLNKGVMAFRNAQFQVAIEHFKNAVQYDPTLVTARLYLATALAQQFIPAVDTPQNTKTGQDAIDQFSEVLKIDPNNTTAMASIGQLYYGMKDFDKAKQYQRDRLQVEPNNPEPYYWIGVIDWAVAQKNDADVRKDLKLTVPDPKTGYYPPLPEKARASLEDENSKFVSEGLDALQKAINLKPNDFNTMAYINLMYRQKADIDTDKEARLADLKTADGWQQKALEAQRAGSSETSSSGG
jgi:tetratricopeptide (TPR) repeat protein